MARASDDASLTRAGMLAGTPHYMSPEQARGEPVDQRSDLFSLGSVLFAMASGRPPIDRELGSETIERIANGCLPSLASVASDTPSWFVRLVDWLHSSDPARRPSSSQSVAEILEQCLAHHRQPSKTELPSALTSRTRRVPLGRFLAVSVLLPLTLLLGLLVYRELRPDSSAKQDDTRSVFSPSPTGKMQRSSTQPESDPDGLASSTEDPRAEWNAVERDVESMSDRAELLERNVNEIWQHQPTSAGRAHRLSENESKSEGNN